jgi:GxxExxY protein
MDANNVESLLHKEITEEIIKAYYTVYNELGFGFLEKVYQNAMVEELKTSGFEVECQKKILVHYKEKIVGEYFADIIVNNKVIIELKSCETIVQEHEVQLLNYLKATEIEVGLLLNFGKRVAFKRKICTNNNKKLNLFS